MKHQGLFYDGDTESLVAIKEAAAERGRLVSERIKEEDRLLALNKDLKQPRSPKTVKLNKLIRDGDKRLKKLEASRRRKRKKGLCG
jgi:hypothetical protein